MANVLARDECMRLVAARLRPTDLVVSGLGSTARSWKAAGGPQLTYYASDPMGMGPTIALGLALARPQQRVILLEGDGNLLMSLGALATIAGAAPPNLKVILFANGCYETTGMQPTAAADRLQFALIAEGAGFPSAREAAETAGAERTIAALLAEEGLGFLALKVATAWTPYAPAPPLSIAEEKVLFQQALAARDRAAATPDA
ncbi:MAG TPA: thiamine pyrophosphate-dependent enzyme [Chloroflexota bacterium]|jgi:thiamine pyrophosphate-dependent acetolactate synthase large subunit-like protein